MLTYRSPGQHLTPHTRLPRRSPSSYLVRIFPVALLLPLMIEKQETCGPGERILALWGGRHGQGQSLFATSEPNPN